jgi:hypothetical protein
METATMIPVDVVLLPERCYRCGGVTAPVCGLWFQHASIDGDAYEMLDESGGWFLEYDDSTAAVVAAACPNHVLAAHEVGPLEWRTTRLRPDGYLANTCHHCRAVLGNWPLHEALIEYQAEGGRLDELPRISATVAEEMLQQG